MDVCVEALATKPTVSGRKAERGDVVDPPGFPSLDLLPTPLTDELGS